jgi:hypothetical protein
LVQDIFEGDEYERQPVEACLVAESAVDQPSSDGSADRVTAFTYIFRQPDALDHNTPWLIETFLPRVDDFLANENERGWFQQQRIALGLAQ